MISTKGTAKTKKLKGSVLFTVLVVMVCLLVLLITTIGLAEAATKRAYREYNDRQTMSTARSLVDSVIASFDSETGANKDVGKKVISEIKSSGHSEVIVNGGANLGDGFGRVDSLVFDKIGTDTATPGAGNYNFKNSGDMIIKVTATVTQGGITSTFSQYVTGASDTVHASASGGGLVALGGFDAAKFPGVDTNSPAYYGISSPVALPQMTFGNSNNGSLWNLVSNAPILADTTVRFILGSPYGSNTAGSYVNGDLTVKSGEISISAYGDGKCSVRDNPYIFINGSVLSEDAGNGDVGGKIVNSTGSPINLYCDSFNVPQNGISGYINIFCYDETGTSVFDKATTELLSWVDKQSGGQQSGCFYTLGNLKLGSNGGKIPKMTFKDGIYVKNNLIIDHDVALDNLNGRIFVETPEKITGTFADKFKTDFASNIFYNTSDEFKNNYLIKQINGSCQEKDKMDRDTIEKSIETPQTAREKYYDKTTSDFLKNVTKSKLDINKDTPVYWSSGETVYTCKLSELQAGGGSFSSANQKALPKETVAADGGSYSVISNSGIVVGTLTKKILIRPDETNSILERDGLWLNFYNVNIDTATILVDDSKIKTNFYFPTQMSEAEPDSGVGSSDKYQMILNNSNAFSDSTSVVSYWPTEVTATYKNKFYVNNCDFIGTLRYYEALRDNKNGSSTLNIVTYPDLDDDDDNDWMIPNFGIYSSDANSTLFTVTSSKATITADICLANASMYHSIGSPAYGKITYNSQKNNPGDPTETAFEKEVSTVGFIGSLIVKELKEFNNDPSMIYVDKGTDGSSDIDEDPVYRWKSLAGFANY